VPSTRRALNLVLAIGLADALLLLVLLYVAFVDRSDTAVSIIGPIHGVGYLLLLGLTAHGASEGRWGWWFPVAVLLTGGPLGSILGEIRVRRELRRQPPASPLAASASSPSR
jgi:integral membrane protein